MASHSPVRFGTPDHGGTYIEAVTGKPRQFDYRVRIHHHSRQGEQSLLLAVECKNLHESSPPVVCGRARAAEEAYHTFIRSEYQKLSSMPLSAFIRRVENVASLYRPGEFVGKSLLRPKADGRGGLRTDTQPDIYDRWSQAVASCREPAVAACSSATESCPSSQSFVMPIVVVPDNRLWKATYNSGGSLVNDPEMVDHCQFFIAAPLHLDARVLILTHIHFLTIKGLFELLVDFSLPERWGQIFSIVAR